MRIKWLVSFVLALSVILATGGGPAAAQESTPQDTTDVNIYNPAVVPWVLSGIQGAPEDTVGENVAIALHPNTHMPYIAYTVNDGISTWLRLATYVATGGNCSGGRFNCEDVEKVTGKRIGLNASIDVRVYPDAVFPSISRRAIGITYVNQTDKTVRFAENTCNILNGCGWSYSTIQTNSHTGNGIDTAFKYSPADGQAVMLYGLPGTITIPLPPPSGSVTLPTHTVVVAKRLSTTTGDCGPSNRWDCTNLQSDFGSGSSVDVTIDHLGNVTLAYIFAGTVRTASSYPAPIASCSSPDGNIPWTCNTIDSVGTIPAGETSYIAVGTDTSAAPFKTQLAYLKHNDGTNMNELYFAFWKGSGTGTGCSGSNNYTCYKIDEMGSDSVYPILGLSLDMAPDNATPVIAYASANATDSGLWIAYPAVFLGGNCGPVVGSPFAFHTWTCHRVESSGMPGRFPSIAIAPDTGLITIAHFQAYMSGELDLAQQRYQLFQPLVTKP